MASKTLKAHFDKVRTNLISLSEHLSIAKHGDIKGAGREALINQFLKSSLPSQVEFYTGEILDKNDLKSGQIDIIVQAFTSPKIHLLNDLKIALSDSVIAIIEVKSNLTTGNMSKESHLKQALDTFRKVKALQRDHKLKGNSTHNNHPNTPCVLFSFSGPTIETLTTKLVEYSEINKITLDEFAPDLTIVLDKNYSIFRNDGWISPKNGKTPFLQGSNKHSCVANLFVYLSKIIEVWNSTTKFTKFQEYL